MRNVTVLLMALTLQLGLGGNARSDEDDHLGMVEYEIACMPCHGVEGRGDGPLAHSLKFDSGGSDQDCQGQQW